MGLGQQLAGGGVIGNGKAVGVLHALVAAQLDCAQPQRRNQQLGGAQRAVQVVQAVQWMHQNSSSQAGAAMAGRGSSGSGACGVG